MTNKKRPAPPNLVVEEHVEEENTANDNPSNDAKRRRHSKEDAHLDTPMEKLKMRRALDKERHKKESTGKETTLKLQGFEGPTIPYVSSGLPEIHIDIFNGLASAECSVREAAAEKLVKELQDVQRAYEELGSRRGLGDGDALMEAERNDGLNDCAPSLRYAIRRLIRGVSSPREYARPGFALGLALVLEKIPSIKVSTILKLIVELLEVSCAMKGQEVRECLFGRLFAYGALSTSGRIVAQQISDNEDSIIKDFTGSIISLSRKKRYLTEPAVSVILDLIGKLPDAFLSQVLEAPGICEMFHKAADVGDPDALFLALKLQERIPLSSDVIGELLPRPFNSNTFFSRDHLSYLTRCFTESSFCLPRVHSIWPLLINLLIPDTSSFNEEASLHLSSSKKHKKSRKGSLFEDTMNSFQNFCEVVIEESMLLSSHDRKLLAFEILLLLLPRLPASCLQVVVSNRLVLCLMDILSTQGTWLQKAAQHFLEELIKWTMDSDDRQIGLIISLQKHSSGKFDSMTRTRTVRDLVLKLTSGPGCLQFVNNLTNLFVVEGTVADEPSDQSETTDESGSPEDLPLGIDSNADFLKNWVIETMSSVFKKLVKANTSRFFENSELDFDKFHIQVEILKFLAVQGLFSASLGTEVTSFELEEKFKWPKAAVSSSLRKMCIEHLMQLLEAAQKMEGTLVLQDGLKSNDLGSYFIGFLNTLCNIPSILLYRTLSNEDEKAFKKLQAMASRLGCPERCSGLLRQDAIKLHAVRFLLIQLLLQVLLCPDEFSESAIEIVLCCKKAFHAAAEGESDDEFDDNDAPEFMDVLVDTFLSLLPQASSPLAHSIEQVFKWFCDDITHAGIIQMLRIVKKDIKPGRHQVASSDNDDDDDGDFLGFEEKERTIESDYDDMGDLEGKQVAEEEVDSEEILGVEKTDSEIVEDDENDPDENTSVMKADEKTGVTGKDGKDGHSASDDSDGGMDDDAMFEMDAQLSQIFKERKLAANDSALSQLVPFKLHVLSLLEIYLHRNPGKPHVFTIYSHLAGALVNYQSVEHSQQLVERIWGILNKKIFKAKEYPVCDGIELPTVLALLQKSLKLASRTRHKAVLSLSQASTFWLLKIVQAKNASESDLDGISETIQQVLADYFESRASRLRPGFVKEIIRRHPWLGPKIFGFLLEKCRSSKLEFRRLGALELVDSVMKLWVVKGKAKGEAEAAKPGKFPKGCLPALCELVHELLSRMPEKRSRRTEVRGFCSRVLRTIDSLKLKKAFLKSLAPEAYIACEIHVDVAFRPFKTPQ